MKSKRLKHLEKATMVNNELGNKVLNISLTFEILDKYNIPTEIIKEQEDKLIVNYNQLIDYKNAWKELKNDNTEIIEYGNRAVKDCKLYKNKKMYLLEQKYNLGGE